MIANGGSKTKSTPSAKTPPTDVIATLKSIPSRIKTIHVLIALGLFAVFLGYISVAPPTDLPNWPLYKLNSKTWQTFEKWGQHVKPYHVRILTIALQHIESRALYILVYLKVPDILSESGRPMTCEELKAAVDDRSGYEPINLPFFCRVLHAASHFDLLVEAEEGKYYITPLSEYLVSTHPKSLKDFVQLYSGDEALVLSTSLSHSIFSGNSGFKETYRTELLEHLENDPVFREVYGAGLADSSRLNAPALISDYPPFSSCKHICDIGGGVGSFLYAVLDYYGFGMKGTNFDLPNVIAASHEYLRQRKADGQITVVAGNFSEKVPKFECDCYVLKDVLQNWSDEEAAVILGHLYGSMSTTSRLLVIETVMHTGSYSEEKFKSLMDLTMMAFHPSHSRLRTEEELYFLLEQSGFADPQTYPTRAGYSIIETFPSS